MCWKPLLLLLLCYDAQATVPHRWSRGELLFTYLFDAHHSFLNTTKNLGEGCHERGKEIRSPTPSSAGCFLLVDV